MLITPTIRKYFRAIGAKGGSAGKGKAKARTSDQARQAALARWTKVKAVKKH